MLWPSVPFTVEPKSVGTAYGLITAIQNSGLAAFPLIISALYDASDSKYIPNVELFFTGCAIAGVAVGIFLNIMDARNGGKLNSKDGKVSLDDSLHNEAHPSIVTLRSPFLRLATLAITLKIDRLARC